MLEGILPKTAPRAALQIGWSCAAVLEDLRRLQAEGFADERRAGVRSLPVCPLSKFPKPLPRWRKRNFWPRKGSRSMEPSLRLS